MRRLTCSTFALLLWAGCGLDQSSPEADSTSSLVERPHRGEWAAVGARPVVFREGYEDQVGAGEVQAEEPAEALERAPDEGDRTIFADDVGRMFLRTDRVITLQDLVARAPYFPEGAALTAGEAGDAGDKDIHGGDDRTLWSVTTGYPARAHAALRSTPNSTTHFCSASAIGPRHVLTAGHCLYSDGAFTKNLTDLRVVFGQNGSGNASDNTPYGKRRVVAWVLPQGWINSESRRYDYALLILEDQSFSPGWLGFAAYDALTLLGMNVNINGYPGHSYSCAASPRADGLCGGYLYHGYGPILLATTNELLTQVDWEKGNSGGPLYRFTDGERYVVGIVSASNPLYNVAARMRSGMADSLCSWIGDYPSAYFTHGCQ